VQAKLTILGLYNADDSIFEQMVLPEGIDSDQVIDDILMECAELELLYPSWEFMHHAIKRWSQKSQYKWEKLLATENFEYNPIWNKDGTIKETETRFGTGTAQSQEESNTSGSDSQTVTGTRDSTDELKVSAFDSSTYNNREQRTVDEDTSTAASSEGTANSSRTGTSVSQNEEGRTYERTEQGNIGVTTTQQMIKEEREVSDFSIYDVIVQDFKERFCVIVY